MAISRNTWGARPPKSRTAQRPNGEVFIHHTVSHAPAQTREAERQHMRELQNAHMDGNGWSDLGYSFVLFPSGRLYFGRGSVTVPAAQAGHNTGTIAISCVGNFQSDRLTKAAEARLVLALKRLRKKGYARTVRGHQQAPGQATACPGSNIMAILPRIRKAAGLR